MRHNPRDGHHRAARGKPSDHGRSRIRRVLPQQQPFTRGSDGRTDTYACLEGLPAGKYEVTATLARTDGTELLEVLMVAVFGPPR